MNAQHPVQTIKQRRAIAAYTAAQRGADAARESQLELERLLAAKRADEAAREERYRRLRTPHVSDVQPDPETVPSWVAWALMCALSLLLTAGALAFAIWLPRIWEWVA